MLAAVLSLSPAAGLQAAEPPTHVFEELADGVYFAIPTVANIRRPLVAFLVCRVREKSRRTSKPKQGFLKNIRGFFRKKGMDT